MASDDTTYWEVRWLLWPRRMIDGQWSDWSELLARRKVSGRWQYRMPTMDELVEHFHDQW